MLFRHGGWAFFDWQQSKPERDTSKWDERLELAAGESVPEQLWPGNLLVILHEATGTYYRVTVPELLAGSLLKNCRGDCRSCGPLHNTCACHRQGTPWPIETLPFQTEWRESNAATIEQEQVKTVDATMDWTHTSCFKGYVSRGPLQLLPIAMEPLVMDLLPTEMLVAFKGFASTLPTPSGRNTEARVVPGGVTVTENAPAGNVSTGDDPTGNNPTGNIPTRNNPTGEAGITVTESEQDMLPWDQLRDTSHPILHYASVMLYNDDLSDTGDVTADVKLRVMDDFWYCALHQHVRIDGKLDRDIIVRVFHSFGSGRVIRSTLWVDREHVIGGEGSSAVLYEQASTQVIAFLN